jgi:ceramide glucosyltransferase
MPSPFASTWVVLALLYLFTVALTLLRYGRVAAPAAVMPRCTIIVPIKGDSPFLAQNIGALARLEPFEGEVLLAVAHARDPAIPALAPLLARHGERIKLLIGEAGEFANPKLRNVAKAWRAAREEVILLLDDNVALDGRLFRVLLGALRGSTVAATAPPLGRDAEGLPAEIEAAMCNGYLLRIEMLLELFGAAAAFGNALALRKRDLEAAGGLARLAEGPCEDNALSKALRARGGRLTLLPLPITRRIGRRSWRDLSLRHLRWRNCAKCHDPLVFALEPLIGGACFNALGAVALAELLPMAWWTALGASALVWYGAEALLHVVLRWPVTALTPLAWVLRDVLQPVVTVQALFTRRVLWRGEVIDMRFRWRRSGTGRAGPRRSKLRP